MHLTESGKHNKIHNVIGTPTHPLHFIKMTSILYSPDRIFNDSLKKEAVDDIKVFLFTPDVDNNK